MTAHEDAIRRIVEDAQMLHDDEQPRVADHLRRHLRTGTRGAVVAATAGAMTLGPAAAAVAAEGTAVTAPAGRLWTEQDAPVVQPAPDPPMSPLVAPPAPSPADLPPPDLPPPDLLPPAPSPADLPPPDLPPIGMPPEIPGEQPPPPGPDGSDGQLPTADPTPPPPGGEDGEAPMEVIPGIRPPVVIPLNGRESMAPPRIGNPLPIPGPQIPNVGQPEIQGGRPQAPSAPPDPEPGGERPPLPVPQPDPSPSRPVIVGKAPAPSPVGGGISDITLDFSDPADADVAVETRPIPLDGITTYVVVPGDSLWSIATDLLADIEVEITTTEVGAAVEVIYEVNRAVIGNDPNLLAVGTTLEIPYEFVPETTTTADD